MSPTKVLNKLHHVSQKGVEKATIAQVNSTDSKVKSFASQQEKDLQKLDQMVIEIAKDRSITLGEPAVTMRAEEPGTADNARLVPMHTDPTNVTGMSNETRERSGINSAIENDAYPAKVGNRSEFIDPDPIAAKAARMDRLRSLKGTAFDTEYLAMAVEGAQKHIAMLEGARVKGDAKLNRLFDQAIKTFRDHQQQAEKLQRTLRAS